MRRLVASILLVAVATSSAWAEPCKKSYTVIAGVQQGSDPKCDGSLLPDTDVFKLGQAVIDARKLEQQVIIKQAELDKEKEKAKADAKLAEDKLTIERNLRLAAEHDVLTLTKPKEFYESPLFWGVLCGTLGTALGVVATLKIRGDI